MDRAYSLLRITKADAESREISGIMSTVETDRLGDQVVSTGIKAKLPAPCLWQHDSHDPIGEIVWIDAKPDGVRFRAKLAKVDSPPSLKEKLDGYFTLIREGLVKGISIGFRILEADPIATGLRIKSWELLEASVVTIPANASCTIQTVKALASRAPTRVVRLSAPVARSAAPSRVVRLSDGERERLGLGAAPGGPQSVGAAMTAALEKNLERAREAAERRKMGATGPLIEAMAAGAKAADAELAAMRARLDALERRK